MKEAEDAFDMLETDAHGVRHRERSIAVKQAIATAFHQAKAVENAIPEMRQQEERAVWKRKLLAGRKEVKEIERRADQIDGISAKKEKLFHGAEEEGGASSSDPRARVEKTSTMLHGQNKSLSRSEQIGLETERIGHETLNTLHGNRETMHHAIERVCLSDVWGYFCTSTLPEIWWWLIAPKHQKSTKFQAKSKNLV